MCGVLCRGKSDASFESVLQLLKLFPEKRLEQPEEEKEAPRSPELGMSWVLRGLQDEKAGKMTSLYRCTDTLFRQNRTGMKCRRSDAAFYTYQDTGIGKAAARALYSPILRGSVTRMELYASCAYAHFFRMGWNCRNGRCTIALVGYRKLFHAAIDMYFTRMKEENRLFFRHFEGRPPKMVAEV